MALEDYTTYTETDPNNDFTVVANTITVSTMIGNVESHVLDDKGVGHFGDYTHQESVEITFAVNNAVCGCHAVTNGSNTHQEMITGNDGIEVYLYRSVASAYKIYLRDFETDNLDFSIRSVSTEYWLTIQRVKATTTATVKIYSDSGRTVLVDTLTITCNTTDYRYMIAVNSREAGGSETISAVIKDLDLMEGVGDDSAGVSYEGVELARDDTSPVKIETPGGTIGVELVAVADADASPIRFYDGVIVKAFKKKV